eukprot:TRINITY_DN6935_c0_g2_i1.p1 TRINITY_DN6935_c0_g2~~TRINITY_DN6935_c0_g2_i1.p1  ORF type:complete len:134 (+),score=27.32 TRINITY_DN6935_c0_g2_i1:235-636(+)
MKVILWGCWGIFGRVKASVALPLFESLFQGKGIEVAKQLAFDLAVSVVGALPPDTKVLSPGKVIAVFGGQICLSCSTLEGASGSPIIRSSGEKLSFVGIHSCSVGKIDNTYAGSPVNDGTFRDIFTKVVTKSK